MGRILRFFFVILLFVAAFALLFFQFSKPKEKVVVEPQSEKKTKQRKSEANKNLQVASALVFVPYWSLGNSLAVDPYDPIIYFGITGGADGISKSDDGYKNLETFNENVPDGKQRLLTVRMTNFSVNFSVLKNEESQKKIANEAIEIARNYGFSGIVLDFELFSFLDKDVPNQINTFVETFYTTTKDNNLSFYLTIYGDVFYKKRPYDVGFLAKNSDGIFIMAYDFHKAAGEPGPNFPLSGREKYGYDFKTMIADFLKVVPQEKITVLFGMYGYDWAVDEKKRPIRAAKSLSLHAIQKKYLGACKKTNCVATRDFYSRETELNYVDQDNVYHVIWFEDKDSAKAKTQYLLEQGIDKVGYWAYGYF
ncbi:hypothetical protein HYT33_04640 [Candidatus Roizmanbacteria bacterium]|nr:hypothetical protein [Candidatus Roizmanbacteria bacterium]